MDEDLEALLARQRSAITSRVPSASVRLSGSALLGSIDHDVDLVVLVDDVGAAAHALRDLYPPLFEDEWRDDWAAFRSSGPPQVDVVVTVAGTKGDAHHRRAWELLLADTELRSEYVERRSRGMDSREKAAFFDRVVAQLEAGDLEAGGLARA